MIVKTFKIRFLLILLSAIKYPIVNEIGMDSTVKKRYNLCIETHSKGFIVPYCNHSKIGIAHIRRMRYFCFFSKNKKNAEKQKKRKNNPR
jgi:hypothetical protein